MKTRRFGSVLLLLLIIVNVPFLPVNIVGAQPTVQTVTLPVDTPTPWQMEYDGSRYIWFSGSAGPHGYLVRVDTWQVISNPSESVQKWEVAPSYHAETGSSYGGASVGVAIGGGYVWSGNQYSGSDSIKTEMLSRFDPSTFEVKHYWLPVEAKGIRAIRYDGVGNIWIAASRIIRFEIATEAVTMCTEHLGVYDLLVDGSTLWATASLPKGVIKFDMNTLTYTRYVPSSYPALLTKDSVGNIWFSMNNIQSIGKLSIDGKITEYKLAELGGADAPYGLAFDDGGKLWVAGYGANKILQWDPSTVSVTTSLSVANMPYYPVKGGAGNIWCWGQGSVYLNMIVPASTSSGGESGESGIAASVIINPTQQWWDELKKVQDELNEMRQTLNQTRLTIQRLNETLRGLSTNFTADIGELGSLMSGNIEDLNLLTSRWAALGEARDTQLSTKIDVVSEALNRTSAAFIDLNRQMVKQLGTLQEVQERQTQMLADQQTALLNRNRMAAEQQTQITYLAYGLTGIGLAFAVCLAALFLKLRRETS